MTSPHDDEVLPIDMNSSQYPPFKSVPTDLALVAPKNNNNKTIVQKDFLLFGGLDIAIIMIIINIIQ